MATYLDHYEIQILINEQLLEEPPTEFNFSVFDGLRQYYPQAQLALNDATGLIQEALLTAEGMKVEITYGTTDLAHKCEYVITKDSLNKPLTKGMFNGEIAIILIHHDFADQIVKSAAYEDRISEIVKELVQNAFGSYDISGTGNQDIWYQPLMNDKRFIEEILLPNAYANDSSSSPFYGFGTVDDKFNFKHLHGMFDSQTITLTYKIDTEQEMGKTAIIGAKRTRPGSRKHRRMRNREFFFFSREDGEMETEEIHISDYPAEQTTVTPILGDKTLITGYRNMGWKDTDVGPKETQKGERYSSMRDGMFLDQIMCIVPLNPEIMSGVPIDLECFTATSDSVDDLSQNWSGKWLVMHCEHVWNGADQQGFTKMQLGRKFLNLPSNYLIKSKLIQ